MVSAVWRYPSVPACTWADVSHQDPASLRTAIPGETTKTGVDAQTLGFRWLNCNFPAACVATVPGNAPMKAALVRKMDTIRVFNIVHSLVTKHKALNALIYCFVFAPCVQASVWCLASLTSRLLTASFSPSPVTASTCLQETAQRTAFLSLSRMCR